MLEYWSGGVMGRRAIAAAAPLRHPIPPSLQHSITPVFTMDPIKTEIVVVGAGPGGYAAAFYAADLGKKVILVERD